MFNKQNTAGDAGCIARAAQDDYMCLGHEFPSLLALKAWFSSQGLDYAVEAAGALIYHRDRSIGHLRIVVFYDLFESPGFAVIVIRH